VRQRAKDRCEYCRLPAGVTFDPFHVDHIVSRQHQGETVPHNLAFACSHCNSHKGPNLTSVDPKTMRRTGLFNPRVHNWPAHFVRRGAFIRGISPIGRATVEALDINDPGRVELRLELIDEGNMPVNDP
jgi:hypothetical protein